MFFGDGNKTNHVWAASVSMLPGEDPVINVLSMLHCWVAKAVFNGKLVETEWISVKKKKVSPDIQNTE